MTNLGQQRNDGMSLIKHEWREVIGRDLAGSHFLTIYPNVVPQCSAWLEDLVRTGLESHKLGMQHKLPVFLQQCTERVWKLPKDSSL